MSSSPASLTLSRGRVLTYLSLHGSVGTRRGQHLRMTGTPPQQAQAGWAPALAFRVACLFAFPHTPGRRQPCRLLWAHWSPSQDSCAGVRDGVSRPGQCGPGEPAPRRLAPPHAARP
ncbi:unnamed protein product [Rangifer tarandus platyrhynchus]|uniref:Uncharacterized protein n=2 Tax=Rangifer tarandus platyrhynchus TaxID=3082113 RepID=A0AC59ZRZ5_RANTA|nr:unnamed protein product [Rangifer tarandus platyrhynchus]